MSNQPATATGLRVRRPKVKEGDFFSIVLENGQHAYGRVLGSPALAFYDGIGPVVTNVQELIGRPVLFRIWAMKDCFKCLNWQLLGNQPLEEHLRERLIFFKKDSISGELSLYYSWPGKSEEKKATRQQCVGLECAAVWSACHVEQRLLDHYHEVPNKSVQVFARSLDK